MMTEQDRGLVLFNSMGKKEQLFIPLEEGRVKVFTCGPSIYARPHIGNYRTFIFQDMLVRYLRYRGYKVKRAMNLTDVEDKAVSMAEREGISVKELTERNERHLLSEWDMLGMERPDAMPRSSRSVPGSVSVIKALVKKGHAYRHGRNIYYDAASFKGFGRLFGLDMASWPKVKRRFHKDTYPGIQWNRGDFVIWHGCSEEERVCWDEELGNGRPSWNVQDPAMCREALGTSIDIWCGGWDNLWRHHDYNIAVMEGAFGEELAQYWLHGGHLLIDGKKMSKSKGNILYPEDVYERGFTPGHLRFHLMYGPYRVRRNMTWERMARTSSKLDRFKGMIEALPRSDGKGQVTGTSKRISSLEDGFRERMDDDLDVKGAFDVLYDVIEKLHVRSRKGRLSKEDGKRTMMALDRIDTVLCILRT
ncbi:MAG: class I tRNA ligase family protein [Candidatus Thermoplasmatota archaeon]|jgi:cysteinyl-tRNA synthetase|nr:class I tRNA ligase family protein [Candidatus Thermoplasmatota archaeon]